jgi:hypothetical protein
VAYAVGLLMSVSDVLALCLMDNITLENIEVVLWLLDVIVNLHNLTVIVNFVCRHCHYLYLICRWL